MVKLSSYLSLLAVSAATLQVCYGALAPQEDAIPARRFAINLDLPPKQRWGEVVKAYKTDLESVLKLVKTIVPTPVLNAISLIGQKIETAVPYPYNYEIMGIAGYLDDITVGDVLLSNLLYEITAFSHGSKSRDGGGRGGGMACTSIVAEAMNGSIFHGRNLDYSLVKYLENMTITVDFQRGGKTNYTGTTFAGFIGVFTGQKPYKYTISLDERDKGQIWMNALEGLSKGLNGVASFHIRDALDRDDLSFNDAIVFLADKPLIAPCYLIMGGVKPGEGVVITRDRIALIDLWRINAKKGTWYVLETNYDRWTTPPASDDRRDPAIKAMESLTSANVGIKGIYDVLSTPPVFNNHTTYTVMMSAAYPDLYSTWIRYYGS